MSKNLQTKKVAIVTGASRGIGRAIALRLGQEKFHVAVVFQKNLGQAENVVADIIASGGSAFTFQADVGCSSDVSDLFESVMKICGHIDVVVNNAGVNTNRPIFISETTDDDFSRIFDTNTRGAFYVMREAAKFVGTGGRIINLSTSVTTLAIPGYGAYAASKAPIELLTKILSKELRGRSISVNAVAPGPTDTELFRQGKSDDDLKRFAEMSPLARLGQPSDVAGVVSFLSGDDGAWVNGQIIKVNGGII